MSVLFLLLVLLLPDLSAHAGGWDQCKGCHDGTFAPDAKALKQKYRTADDFVKAAQKSDESLMKHFKKNEDLLRNAARDIGLKE
jgi:hypothetical protein